MSQIIVTSESKQSNKVLWTILAFMLGICFMAVVMFACLGLGFWGLDSFEHKLAANATGTRSAYSANATATHVALSTERAKFGFIDSFDDNSNGWYTRNIDDEYFKGEIKVADGAYTWTVDQVKQGFISIGWMTSSQLYLTDFDVFVDARNNPGSSADFCYGIRFRGEVNTTSASYYVFLVCDQGFYGVYYYDGKTDDWVNLRNLLTRRSFVRMNGIPWESRLGGIT